MASTAHALLSPSSSHRWMHCTPSARLEEAVEEKHSDFAEEGTCAHALCENKLRELLGEPLVENEWEVLKDKWYDKAMEGYTDEYVSYVWSRYQLALKVCPSAKLFIEKKLDFTAWIPDSFGTGDAIIVADDMLEVFYFKYGKGVEVNAVKNTQMAIYALGALADFDLEYDIKAVRMTIIQPRLSHISDWDINAEQLKQWADTVLKPYASKAFKGEGEQVAGDWCKFCKVKAQCSVLANDAIACYTQHSDKALITDEEMGAVLELIPAIKTWCSAVEDYATAQAINGKKFPGYKLVEGRSVRKVTDTDTLISRLLDTGAGAERIFKPAELKPIGDLEKEFGRKEFYELSKDLIEKPKGKPTLVPESDKRQELNTSSAEEDFKNIIID